MSWKRFVEDELRAYPYLKESVGNIDERIKLLESEFCEPKAARLGATPKIGGTSTAEDSMINNIYMRQRLVENKNLAISRIELIEKGLNALNATEKRVLELFYINRQTNHVGRLMEELGYEKTQIYRIRDRALEKYALAMCGAMSS